MRERGLSATGRASDDVEGKFVDKLLLTVNDGADGFIAGMLINGD